MTFIINFLLSLVELLVLKLNKKVQFLIHFITISPLSFNIKCTTGMCNWLTAKNLVCKEFNKQFFLLTVEDFCPQGWKSPITKLIKSLLHFFFLFSHQQNVLLKIFFPRCYIFFAFTVFCAFTYIVIMPFVNNMSILWKSLQSYG